MSADRLARRCLDILGPIDGPIAVEGDAALRAALATAVALATDDRGPVAAAVVSFWSTPARPSARQTLLASLARRLPHGAPIVLVDHNQPRALWRRAVALPRLLAAGLAPARARYPAARELRALGFEVERLRLESGERMQVVGARRS